MSTQTEDTPDIGDKPNGKEKKAAKKGAAAKPKATKGAKGAKGAKGDKGDKGKGARSAAGPALPSIAAHPRAGAQVARAKAWAGLAGFLLVGLLSWRAGVPTPDVLLRAIAGGTVAYVIAWACAVTVWRHLVIAELRAVRAQRLAEAARRSAQRADAAG